MLPIHRFLATTFCLTAMSSIACLGQNPVKFSTVTSATAPTAVAPIAIDVNNDGIPDIVQITNPSTNQYGYAVSIAKGNGSFDAPANYSFPSRPGAMGFADMNGDGKVDMIVPLSSGAGNQIAVYLGNGNGTFQAPKISTIDLPSGTNFQISSIATADFNHDGKIDVVATAGYAQGAGGVAVILAGDGTGGLTNKGTIFSIPSTQYGKDFGPSLVTGDFDADNNADVAFWTGEFCGGKGSGECYETVYVLYGNGAFGFQQTTPYATTGSFNLASGDLNGDGRTDLFGIEVNGGGTNQVPTQLVLLYGQSNRTFATYYYSNIPGGFPGGNGIGTLAMADFNGDNRMDLVGYNPLGMSLTFFLAGTGPGEFTTQSYTLLQENASDVVIGDFNNDKRPDVAVVQGPYTGGSATIVAAINQTWGWYGACPYPKTGQGISLCTPANGSSDSNPTAFNASASSFGMIRKFELWVDGKKIAEQHHTWGHNAFFADGPSFPAGYHRATLNVTTIDNDAMQYNFTFKTN